MQTQTSKVKGDLPNITVINFNGDDAIALKKDGAIIDSIGQAGARVNNIADVTLVRNSNVLTGDKIIDDAFEPSVEWTALSKDDSSNLGIHGSAFENPDDPKQGLQIHHLQGAGHQSPMVNEKVADIEGIVTYEYKIGSGNYFHMQTPDIKGITIRTHQKESLFIQETREQM